MKSPNWLSQRSVQKKETIALIYKSNKFNKSNKSTTNQASEYWTYAQLESQVNQCVDYLQDLGIKSGDRVGLLLTNHPIYIILIHALVKCEAVAVFLNIRLTASELSWQIEDSLTKYLLCDEFNRAIANSIEIDSLNICLNICEIPNMFSLTSKETSKENLKKESINLDSINLDDIQGIFYTSGTTGKPKGVPLTYNNHFHSSIASALHLGVNAEDNWLLCMPMFHVGGCAIAWRSVINGTKMTLLPKFNEQEVLDAIKTENVTLISLVPTMLTRLLRHPNWQNLQKLRGILLGGASASAELVTQCLKLNLPIMPTYGMTETASQITTLSVDEVKLKQGSSGLPLFGNLVRIVDLDDSTQEMPIGAIGQILVQGANVMGGYLHQSSNTIIQDGWLHTGDLGYLDHDEYLYVVSRRSDLIICGGENIYPREIESILLEHPAIAEACVLGIGDRDWGEIVVAVLVTKSQLSLAEIRDFCGQKSLARYKLPKAIYIWESIPKSASGKVLRQQIRDCI